MSEPKTAADRVDEVVPGVLHWSVVDDRIDHRSEAYAVRTPDGPGGLVLIDPLPLDDERTAAIEEEGVAAICLTGGFHQRSAWRLAERFGAAIWMPRGAKGLEGEPDHWYDADDRLPGALRALHAPGPTEPHACLMLERSAGAVLFGADLLMRGDDGLLAFVPDEHQDEPERTRESVRRLLPLRPATLCPAHGAPVVQDALGAMKAALAADTGRAGRREAWPETPGAAGMEAEPKP